MPELPEVETIRRGLEPLILKKKIVQVDVDSTTRKAFHGDESEVVDTMVEKIERRGKALLLGLSNGKTVMIHLRMTGQLIWRDASFGEGVRALHCETQAEYDELMAHQFAAGHPSKNFMDELPNKQTRVTFLFEDGALYFNDQRKFGFVKVLPTEKVEEEKFIRELAKEPWEMSVKELFRQCQRHTKAPIKAVLLDQKVIAGLGNIYADESLFYAGVHPATKAGDLSEEQVGLILEGARSVMLASIDSGGSTMATYVKPDGTTGSYLENFAQVFRREGKECRRCGEKILKTRVAGRGTHYCPKCQKEPKLKKKTKNKGEATDA